MTYFKTVDNFRDIGGYPCPDEKEICWGMIYRSADFNRISPGDQEILSKMGIKNIIDLRTPGELIDRPNLLDQDFNQINVPLSTKRMKNLWNKISAGYMQSEEERYQYKRKNTAGFIAENIESIHRIINLLLNPDIYPVVIHCGQGKDRTGAVIASLLWLLGVNEPDITRDYLLSNNVSNLSEYVKPEYINPLYDFLHKNQNLGVSEKSLVQLKRLLLQRK